VRCGALIALVVALAGCKGYPDVCSDYGDKTCIALQISSTGPTAVDTIQVAARSGFTLTQDSRQLSLPKGTATPLPILVPILPASLSAPIVLVDVSGMLHGNVVGTATFTTGLHVGDHVHVTVDLTAATATSDMGGGGGGGGGGGVSADLGAVACDPVTQSICGSGSKCTFTDVSGANNSATECIANGTVGSGRGCTTTPDNCAAGEFCIPSLGYCAHFCRSDSDCPRGTSPNFSYCGTFNSVYAVGSVSQCTVPCNPVLAVGPSGCINPVKCDAWSLPSGDMASTEYTDCGPAGAGTDGASCANSVDCAAGYGCVFTSGGGHCRMYCRGGTNGDCTISGETCRSITGWTFTGACCPSTGC